MTPEQVGKAIGGQLEAQLQELRSLWHFVKPESKPFSVRAVAELIAERDAIPLGKAIEMTPAESLARFRCYLNPTVILRGEGMPITVLGETLDPLTPARYRIVKAMQDAGDRGLSKADLEGLAGDALKTVRRMREDNQLWERAIIMAGKSGGRYRIKPAG